MKALDPFVLPTRGAVLLEASAGTGKTWTIVSLAVRMVVERELPIQSVLVLTFTRAATGELKERLRLRLGEAHAVLAGRVPAADEFMGELHRRYAGNVEVIRRLDAALQHYDEAAVTTIHGYCQRVLSEQAFASGADLDLELQDDQLLVLREVVENFWRECMEKAEAPFAAYLARRWQSPGHLLAAHQHHFRQPIALLGPGGAREDGLYETFCAARADLQNHADALSAAIPKRAAALMQALASVVPAKVPPAITDARKLVKGSDPHDVSIGQVILAFCEALKALHASYDRRQKALRLTLLTTGEDRYLGARSRLRALSYHDFLVDLDRALRDSAGHKLAGSLRDRYPVALVDEFQDTDPLQASIFQQIYVDAPAGDHALYLVGDPKQAIYAFRGADVFAYLRMARLATEKLTLQHNWRSAPRLIEATNVLFASHARPFGYAQIPFVPVAAASKKHSQLDDPSAPDSGLSVWVTPPGLPADRQVEVLSAATASEIQRLVSASISLAGRKVSGRDIAVLVRTHKQAAVLRQALRLRGVASVSRGGGSVFDSDECGHVVRLMRAVANPRNMAVVKGALTTPLFGWDAEAILELSVSPAAWQVPARQIKVLESLWHEFGIAHMLLSVIKSQTAQERLLGLPDGQRRLTNYRHLAELLDTHASRAAIGQDMSSLVEWTLRQRFQESPAEDRLLRLETDEDLVSVVTLHASKGLEYPIVFCPFLFHSVSVSKSAGLAYHDIQAENRSVLQLGEPDRRELDLARGEMESEVMRLAYVALTRAEHRSYVVMLHPDSRKNAVCPVGHLLQIDSKSDRWSAQLNDYVQQTGSDWRQVVEPSEVSSEQPLAPAAAPGQFRHRHFTRRLARHWGVTSFSALKHQMDPSGQGQDFDFETHRSVGSARDDKLAIPGGVRTGIVLHRLLELASFQWPRDKLSDFVTRQLDEAGHTFLHAAAVTQLLWRVLQSPLGHCLGSTRLCDVTRAQRIDELGFYFAIDELPSRLTQACLVAFERDAQLGTGIRSGFLRGFIDLVFEAQDRYFVVDYKSNFLGSTFADYSTDALDRVMQDTGYDVQGLIYAQALHRQLALRVPNYDYEKHFGGVVYLFLRGMNPTNPTGHSIHFSRPSLDAIHAFDHHS